MNRNETFDALTRMEYVVSRLRRELTTSVSILPERAAQIKLACNQLVASLEEDPRFAKMRVELPSETYAREQRAYGIASRKAPTLYRGLPID